jgi:hypothetical protein
MATKLSGRHVPAFREASHSQAEGRRMNEYIITVLRTEKYSVAAATVEDAAAEAKKYLQSDAKLVSVVELELYREESKAS